MNDRRAKMIAQILHFMEELDGDELKGAMAPAASEDEPSMMDMASGGQEDKDAPMDMDKAMAMAGNKAPEKDEDEPDDDELEELSRLSG